MARGLRGDLQIYVGGGAGWSCVMLRSRNGFLITTKMLTAQVPRILLIKIVTRTFECELCNLNV